MMKVLFDHLQKTGGTALTDFLRKNVGEQNVSPLIQHESVIFASTLTDSFDVVAGHLHLSPSYEPDPDHYHLTILRDPIERFISHYSYVCEQPNSTDAFGELARRSKDLPSLLLLGDENVLMMVQDFYVRHFAALFLEGDQLRDALSDDRLSGRDLFTLISSRYQLLGISETMDRVAWILSRLMGFPNAPVPRVRVTKQRVRVSDLDAGTLKILHKLTARDYEFYAMAKAQFDTVAKAFAAVSDTPHPSALALKRLSAAPPPDTTAVLAAELFCPTSGHHDRAISGDPCMLSFAIDGRQRAIGDSIALRITNTLHQLVYRDTRQVRRNTDEASSSFELIWRFVCPLGPGDYNCALGFGLRWEEDVYRFGVDQKPGASWAGLVNVQTEIIVLGGPPSPAELKGWLAPSGDSLEAGMGEMVELSMEIGNTGGAAWEPHGIYRVVLSYRISTVSGESVVMDGLRTVLVGYLNPTETRTVTMRLQAPEQEGQYVVTPSFVCERIAWFGASKPIKLLISGHKQAAMPASRMNPRPPASLLNVSAGRDALPGRQTRDIAALALPG